MSSFFNFSNHPFNCVNYYDPNGNITTLSRKDDAVLLMDNLQYYHHKDQIRREPTNWLEYVNDAVGVSYSSNPD